MHDPEHTTLELAEKLSSRNRHIVFLIGAGASCAVGLPSIEGIKNSIGDTLEGDEKETFIRLAKDKNIEEVLSRLRLIAAVLEDSADQVDDITSEMAVNLDQKICQIIADLVGIKSVDCSVHERFARWAGHSHYKTPIEIFTTNYDILLERGLELACIPYFDGFVGNYEGSFRPDLVDSVSNSDDLVLPARWIRVWKLHGSVSWNKVEKNGSLKISRIGGYLETESDRTLAIYPSHQKYEESRRIPFVVLNDRLRRALTIPETLCIIIGYSFSDEHINELLYDGARQNRASEILALFHSDIPDGVLLRANDIPNLSLLSPSQAVIGTIADSWSEYAKSTPYWNDGKFTLGDFKSFANFIFMNLRNSTKQPKLEAPEK